MLSVILLHDKMVDKHQHFITSSLTLIDLHDIARSCRTFGVERFFVAHPAPSMRKLARTLKSHWQEGFGLTYNPNRSEALAHVEIVQDLDEAIASIDLRTGLPPVLVATSARPGGNRLGFNEFRSTLSNSKHEHLVMLGTGWGMSQELLDRAQIFLSPINGPGEYNHLSVRSACAIMLDRIIAR